MDRLISLEPSNLVAIRIEPGQKCSCHLTLRNVMYTMPVAFRIQPTYKERYTIKPQSGIIAPLCKLTVEIVYHLPPNSFLPPNSDSFPVSHDTFLLHSVVAPGAAIKNPTSSFDAVPNDWFTTKKKQVFVDSGIRIMFVGSPVLVQLAMNGSMDEIREVLERSDPTWKPADSVDSNGRTLLHIAIAQSRADIVQLLLEFEPNIQLQSRLSGYTPLEAAAEFGQELIVELLLAHKASTERSESSNLGPIHLAAIGGHVEVLKLLLLKGARVDSLSKDGNTALHLAVEERRKDFARLLLVNGSNPDVRNSIDGDTPLHIAAGIGDEKMVKFLLQKGANKDVRNRTGQTAYDLAVERGNIRLYDALKLGDSLCLAARKGEFRNIRKLIETGAVINGRDQNGWTALHRASFKGRIDTVRMLIDMGGGGGNGIDVDSRDEDGYTALHCAVESGQTEVVELLVKKGADVAARTNKGVTALQIAESLHYAGISRILIVHGGVTKDYGVKSVSNPFGNGKFGEDEMEMKKAATMKRRSLRARALRRSFDRSLPLTVI